jgi:uncharacterized repeat protein (TIGR04076 family)
VKITVVRRFSPDEVFTELPITPTGEMGACDLFRDGQEFVVEDEMPKGFCASAWASIYPNLRLLALGGNVPGYEEQGVAFSPCLDGLRPVIFKLERI